MDKVSICFSMEVGYKAVDAIEGRLDAASTYYNEILEWEKQTFIRRRETFPAKLIGRSMNELNVSSFSFHASLQICLAAHRLPLPRR